MLMERLHKISQGKELPDLGVCGQGEL
jgi:hypothetical protein